jgi:antirestriction protein ArdC
LVLPKNGLSAIHQHITDRIIAAIEAGAGKWQMPSKRN